MRFRVRVLRRAQIDLVEIDRYLAREAPEVRPLILDRLLDAIEELERFPRRGARVRDPHLRNLGFRYLVQESYLIFYRIIGQQVRVYRVLHGRRAYLRLLK
jgi:toxin ParE1/3/4